ncbi:MAG: CapA family protein [Actinobacteria bacterium]|nr:CapA family protein [Actinomycetota bacterium]
MASLRRRFGGRGKRLRVAGFGALLVLVSACESGDIGRRGPSQRDASPPSTRHHEGSATTGAGNRAAPVQKDVEPAPPTSFTLVATGDILTHSTVYEKALENGGNRYDFDPMFREVEPLLSAADLAICHLETPLSRDNQDLSSYPNFNVPRQLADAIGKAGYDYCSTASNHSYDQGLQGVRATLDALDSAGVRHNGTARRSGKADHPELFEVNGAEVGLLSYTYGLNGGELPENESWLVDVIDSPTILREARAARGAGADFVVVSLHWGLEYQVAPSTDQLTLARQLLRSNAIDLILGHHAHVVQPIGRVRKEYVVYGMGNFLADQSIACCAEATRHGVIVKFEVQDQGGDLRVEKVIYTPTWVPYGNYVITPVARALGDPSTPADTRATLKLSWKRTTTAIRSLGAGKFGRVRQP